MLSINQFDLLAVMIMIIPNHIKSQLLSINQDDKNSVTNYVSVQLNLFYKLVMTLP